MSSRLLLIPLDDVVAFPGMSLTLAVDAGEEERVLLVPRHENEFASVGTVAQVADRVRLPGGARAVALQGLHRGVAGAAHTMPDGRLYVEVDERPDEVPVDGRTRNLEREYRAVVEEILELRGDDGRISSFLRSISEPGALADTSGYSPDLSYENKVELLQTVDRNGVGLFVDLDEQTAVGHGLGGTRDPTVEPLEGHGPRASRQANPIGDLGDRADVGKFIFVSGNEQDSLLLAGVDRERERHAREGHDVVERDQ